jgi:hypothetical protein
VSLSAVTGLTLKEVGAQALSKHWRRGRFPLSYLAKNSDDSATWRQQFIHTFLERDLPQLGISIAAPALLRFWTMVAHSRGGIWNAADPARSLGIEIKRMDAPTVTPSMRTALSNLRLEQLTVVYPPRIRVVPLQTAIAGGIDRFMPQQRARAKRVSIR